MATSRQEGITDTANAYFRGRFRTILMSLIIVIFLLLAMVFFVLYQVFHKPLPVFKAINSKNEEMVLTAFSSPNLLPNTILKWASKAAVAAYTFDFVNYSQQISAVHPYFTSLGWSDYLKSVYRLLEDIAQKQLFVNGVVSGPPIISNQGLLPGKGYVWRVQMPFLVTYQSAENTSRQSFIVMMTIVRIPTSVHPSGIGIDQFVMR